jgi:hypothetical protein
MDTEVSQDSGAPCFFCFNANASQNLVIKTEHCIATYNGITPGTITIA